MQERILSIRSNALLKTRKQPSEFIKVSKAVVRYGKGTAITPWQNPNIIGLFQCTAETLTTSDFALAVHCRSKASAICASLSGSTKRITCQPQVRCASECCIGGRKPQNSLQTVQSRAQQKGCINFERDPPDPPPAPKLPLSVPCPYLDNT
eukprot:scaffold23235_cov22-Tisochrysis_lutea.AAC.1